MLERVSRKIATLADNPRPPGVEKLRGTEDSYRVRVADYRVLYEIHDQLVFVVIVRVRRRREVYR